MGKRKKSSRKPQGPKKREPLSKSFSCLFCNHEKSVEVKLDKKGGIGSLQCKVCGQAFQTNINYLSQHVDVYSDWVDACDAVAEDKDDGVTTSQRERPRGIVAGKERDRGYGGDGADDDDEALYDDD